jgi:hypothetical protein
VDILKDEAVLADATLLTTKEQTFAAALYTIAIKEGSLAVDHANEITSLQAIAQEHFIRSLNSASEALGGTADPFTDAQKRWINGVARSRGEPEPFPGFAMGVTSFAGGIARVHKDELLVNLPRGTSVIPRGESGVQGSAIAHLTAPPQQNFYGTIVNVHGDGDAVLAALGGVLG